MSEVKKVVLAYSDGLDTSIIIPWLKEHYNNCEVIAVCGNVGQKGELEGLEERAKASGASKLYIEDLTDEFVEDYVIPTMQAGVVTRVICWAPALPAPFWQNAWWRLPAPRVRMRSATAAPAKATIRCALNWPSCTLHPT